MIQDFPQRPRAPLDVGISECLLGRRVRYDGSDARSSFPHAALDGVFRFRGVCPEVGIGMGVPRAPIRLIGELADPRAVGVTDPTWEVTDALSEFGRRQAEYLGDADGYVFMRNSPSCGLFRVNVYPDDESVVSAPLKNGRGIYAAAVVAALPNLPVEENGRLFDPVLCGNFVTRTFAYAHWRRLVGLGLTRQRLIEFHSRYKYLLMAHSVPHYDRAGYLLSNLKIEFDSKARNYLAVLMKGLAKPAGHLGHSNVLMHLQGYLKKVLIDAKRRDLDQLIRAYRRGERPLLAALALLTRYLQEQPDQYVLHQAYLDPHPGFTGLNG